MYAIRIDDRFYPDAAQLIFGGVTSRLPKQATLAISAELPDAARAMLEKAFKASCSGKLEASTASRLNSALSGSAIRFHLDGSQDRKTIEAAFLAAVREQGLDIKRWNVVEVPLR